MVNPMQQKEEAPSLGTMVGIPPEPEPPKEMIPQPTATTTPQMAKGGLVKKSRSHPLNKFYGK